MSTIQDTDLLLVNRGGTDYKVNAVDIKEYLTPQTPALDLGTFDALFRYLHSYDSDITDARWQGTGKEGAAIDYVYMCIEWEGGLDGSHNIKTGLYRTKRSDFNHEDPFSTIEKVFYFHELPPDIHGSGYQLWGQDGGYWVITEDLIIKDRRDGWNNSVNVTLDGGKNWTVSDKLNYMGEDDFLGCYVENLGGGKYKFLEAGNGLTTYNRFIEVTIDNSGKISCTGHNYGIYPYGWPVQPNYTSMELLEHQLANNLVCKDSNGFYAGIDWLEAYRWTNFSDSPEFYMMNQPTDKPADADEWNLKQLYWDEIRQKYLLVTEWAKDYSPFAVGLYEFAWGDTTPTTHPMNKYSSSWTKVEDLAFSKIFRDGVVIGWQLCVGSTFYRYDMPDYMYQGQEGERALINSCETPAMWTQTIWQENGMSFINLIPPPS